jgi:hypothetical protein
MRVEQEQRGCASFKKLRARLDELYPETHLQKLLDAASEEHRKQHPFLTKKVKLFIIWIVLHGLIAVLGVAYTLIILVNLSELHRQMAARRTGMLLCCHFIYQMIPLFNSFTFST